MIRSYNGKTPRIAETAFISEAAYVVGDVEIGEHSSVWPGAVIRGDVSAIKIGNNCAVEDNAVLHAGYDPLIIGNKVHIGHAAVINCKKIGNEVLVGMNSTLLHDAEIGNQCIIAASCLVREGMKIPDKSFVVGVPGQIKGQPTEKQLWWVTEAPKEYERLMKEYKEQGL